MASRHTSREHALQMIFQWEASGDQPAEVAKKFWGGLAAEPGEPLPSADAFADELLFGVARHRASIDDLIRKHASNWRLERMPAVDRNILRLAVYEMQHRQTASGIVITEAIELGRRFSGDQSGRFLNGVLDAVGRDLGVPSKPATGPDSADQAAPTRRS